MKSLSIAAVIFSVGLATTSVCAFADDHDHDHDGHDHHYVHHSDWHKGARMHDEDWRRGEHIDYKEHHLRAPPRGYEWREVDGNYVLAAVTTGIIASVIAASIAGH